MLQATQIRVASNVISSSHIQCNSPKFQNDSSLSLFVLVGELFQSAESISLRLSKTPVISNWSPKFAFGGGLSINFVGSNFVLPYIGQSSSCSVGDFKGKVSLLNSTFCICDFFNTKVPVGAFKIQLSIGSFSATFNHELEENAMIRILPDLVVKSIQPSRARYISTGGSVTLIGETFSSGHFVCVLGSFSSEMNVLSDSRAICRVPPFDSRHSILSVRFSGAIMSSITDVSFEYLPPLNISGIFPSAIPFGLSSVLKISLDNSMFLEQLAVYLLISLVRKIRCEPNFTVT